MINRKKIGTTMMWVGLVCLGLGANAAFKTTIAITLIGMATLIAGNYLQFHRPPCPPEGDEA